MLDMIVTHRSMRKVKKIKGGVTGNALPPPEDLEKEEHRNIEVWHKGNEKNLCLLYTYKAEKLLLYYNQDTHISKERSLISMRRGATN